MLALHKYCLMVSHAVCCVSDIGSPEENLDTLAKKFITFK